MVGQLNDRMRVSRRSFINLALLGAAAQAADTHGAEITLSFAPHGSASLANARLWKSVGNSAIYVGNLNEHLTAWFELRGEDVLAWVENSTTNVAGIRSYEGDLSLTVNGQTRATHKIVLCPRQRAAACLPQRLGGGESPLVAAEVDPNVVPFYGVRASERLSAAAIKDYVPLAQGLFPNGMGDGGYDPSIGILPSWDALYLSDKNPRALRQVLVMALLAGRYGIHFRDDKTLELLSFSGRPNLSYNASTKNDMATPGTGVGAPHWALSHHPSIGFLAYLLTGWQYFADQVRFAASYNHFFQVDWTRMFDKGVLLTNAGANQTRGAAWSFRTLVQAAILTPGSQYAAALQHNVDYYHASFVTKPHCPQGWFIPYVDYTGKGDGKYMHSGWMDDFFGAALGYALCALPSDKLHALFAEHSKSLLGRLGPAGDPTAYSYRDAAPYTIAVAPSDTPDFAGGKGPWFQNWGDVYEATTGKRNTDTTEGDPRGGYWPSATSYWGNLLPALAYAHKFAVPGAAEAFARLRRSPGWPTFLRGFADAPVWGVTMGLPLT